VVWLAGSAYQVTQATPILSLNPEAHTQHILGKLDDFGSFSAHRQMREYLRPEILASVPEMFLRDMAELAQRRGRRDWLNVLEKAWRINQAKN